MSIHLHAHGFVCILSWVSNIRQVEATSFDASLDSMYTAVQYFDEVINRCYLN